MALHCKNPPITSVLALLMVLSCVHLRACMFMHVNLHMSVARNICLHVLSSFHTVFVYNINSQVFYPETQLIHLCSDCTQVPLLNAL